MRLLHRSDRPAPLSDGLERATSLIAWSTRDARRRFPVTASILVIGDEILSGRTKDKNIGYIAEYLTAIGIDLKEVRSSPMMRRRSSRR